MTNWISILTLPNIAVTIIAVVAVAALVWTVILFRKLTSPEINAVGGQLDADLERELFKRLWAWLSIVGGIAAAITVGAWVIISAGFAGEARDAANREARLAVEQQLRQTQSAIMQQQDTVAKLQADTNRILDEAIRERIEVARIVVAAKERAKSAEEAAKAAALELEKIKNLRTVTASQNAVVGDVDPGDVARSLAVNAEFQEVVAASAFEPLGGIVVASTRRCTELPGDWMNFEDGAGKFIMGVGDGELRYRGPHRPEGSPNVVSLTTVAFGDQGGAEKHRLQAGEMPQHRHTISTHGPYGKGTHDGLAGGQANVGIDAVYDAGAQDTPGQWSPAKLVDIMSPQGNDKPHNNMPPYVALYFCKKEG